MQKLESNFNALNNIVGHVTPSTGIRKLNFNQFLLFIISLNLVIVPETKLVASCVKHDQTYLSH